MSKKLDKLKIVEKVLQEIPKSNRVYFDLKLEQVMFKWFMTGRQDGLRLTEEGVTAFQLAEIEYYDIEFEQKNQSYHSFILDLNKKIKCPYYLGVNKSGKDKKFYLRIYDSKVAMMMNLYGSVQDYLNSVKVRQND